MASKKNGNGKVTVEHFVKCAIRDLRDPKGKSKGIHSVFSGFNAAFREQFGTDPVEATTKLAKKGVIATRPCRKGVMLYLPQDAPIVEPTGAAALSRIKL